MNTPKRILIVGQGLAGTVLALEALSRGHKLTLFDLGSTQIASRAAAGVLNPVTGPRLNLSWEVHRLMPAAERFYQRWEKELGVSFFEKRVIRRYLQKQSEVQFHEKRRLDSTTHAFLSELHPAPKTAHYPSSALGYCDISGGYVNSSALLDAAQRYLAEHATLHTEPFSYDTLSLHDTHAEWAGQRFEHVIFCEGAAANANPWWNYLPFKPAKGESIEYELEHPLDEAILHERKWVLPLGGTRARTGSTYTWDPLDNQPTEEARHLLLTQLSEMLPDNPVRTIHAQRAGVRPCSHDTRPYVGTHPEHPCLAILNGLGSKGTLQAPACAQDLLDHLEHGSILHPQMDVLRVG